MLVVTNLFLSVEPCHHQHNYHYHLLICSKQVLKKKKDHQHHMKFQTIKEFIFTLGKVVREEEEEGFGHNLLANNRINRYNPTINTKAIIVF